MHQFEPFVALDSIDNVLRKRGLTIASTGSVMSTLYPYGEQNPVVIHPDKDHSYSALNVYLEWFGERSFRKLMSQILSSERKSVPLSEVERIVGSRRYNMLVDFLTNQIRIATVQDAMLTLVVGVSDLGSSLEHYVALLCEKELTGQCAWGIQLEGLPSGGDFDVLAWLAPNLVYVECKSGNPANIDQSQLGAFIKRHKEIGADVSILLVDTDSSIDCIVDRLNEAIKPEYQTNDDIIDAYPLKRRGVKFQLDFDDLRVAPSHIYPSVWFGYHRIYAINSKPSILTQIRRCLMHHHSYMKQHDLKMAKAFSH